MQATVMQAALRDYLAGCRRIFTASHAKRKAAPAPLDHQPAAQHAAEMREVRYPGRRLRDAQEQLERCETEHEDARRHRDRRGEEPHPPGGGKESEGGEEAAEGAPGGR